MRFLLLFAGNAYELIYFFFTENCRIMLLHPLYMLFYPQKFQQMRTSYLVIVALLCFSALAWTNSCPSFYDQDRLESGKYTFLRRGGVREYTFEVPISYQIGNRAVEIACTYGTIGDYNPSSNGFSYELTAQKKTTGNYGQFTLIANGNGGWTSVQISYLMSSRDDFAVGNYNSPANRWVRGRSPDEYEITFPINKNLPNGDYKVAVFISGFSTSDNQFQISVNSRSFDYWGKKVIVSLFCGAYPQPASITFSYVVYPASHPLLEIAYGPVAGQVGAYQISGPTSFSNSNSIEYNEFRIASRFLACTGNECDGICTLKERCVELNGNVYEGQCTFCAPGIVFEAGRCLRRCGPNQIYNNRVCLCAAGFRRVGNECVRDGVVQPPTCNRFEIRWNGGCRACPANSAPNAGQTSCVCNFGQYDANQNACAGGAVQCGYGETYDYNARRCACNPNFGRYGGQCRPCPAGAGSNNREECVCTAPYTYNPQTNVCAVNCPNGQVWNNNGCVCPAQTIPWNGGCRQCPAGSNSNGQTCLCVNSNAQYDANSNSCVTIIQCQRNEELIRKQCVCIKGYARLNGICTQCPKSSTPAVNTCTCNSANAIYIANSNLCVECGANSSPNAQRTACQCDAGYTLQGATCVPIRPNCEWNEDFVDGRCECKYGFIRLGPICVDACGLNEYYDGKNCFCKEGHAKTQGVCRPCPAGTVPNADKTGCICADPNQFFVASSNACRVCPANSSPNADFTDCVCKPGYNKSNGQCVSICSGGEAFPNAEGFCVCPGGKIYNGNTCVVPISCPAGSSFNVTTRTCVCNNRNEHIIDGSCQACGPNSVWSRDQCVCNTGFFLIAGECRTCDPRSKYNGKDCVCNLGFFGNRDLCTPCHKSCSTCSGPEANQCQACSDVSLVLEKGFCSKNSPCDFGFFLENGKCSKCLDNCLDCDNVFECRTCAIGYKTKSQAVAGQNIVSCDEVCGDGIKYEQQCDDGNTANGDGCSSTCEEESGWFCSGGSSNNPSKCRKLVSNQVQLSSKGAVNLGSHVLLSVRASYLPPCLTQNECSTCFKVLKVNVVNANVPILVTVNFVALSQWQYVIKFDFQGLIVTSIFKVVIRLNEELKGCIDAEDFDEQLELTIDPAFLAKSDEVETLTLEDLNPIPGQPPKINVPPSALRNLGL